MDIVPILIICVLGVLIVSLIIFIVKNTLIPKKVDVLPKLIKQGKTQQATKVAKQIISKDSKNFIAHYYLGKAYIKENKLELAIIEYRIVNENALFGKEINEIDFRQEYASLLLKYNQTNEALKHYLLLTKLQPNKS